MKRKKSKNFKKILDEEKPFLLPKEAQKYIFGIIIFALALILVLSFLERAGLAGRAVFSGLTLLIGKTAFFLPLILVLTGVVFWTNFYKRFLGGIAMAIFLLILGISALFQSLNLDLKEGGYLGYFVTWPFLELFGTLVTKIIFGAIIISGGLIFWYLLRQPISEKPAEKKTSLLKRIFGPKFKVKEIESAIWRKKEAVKTLKEPSLEVKPLSSGKFPEKEKYQSPSFDLLEAEKGGGVAGDVRINSAIIKKTLENFDIPVEMSEINIGPTVTQYTLKPAEGIKLSKITTLSNDLALALASHPIRIEAPIPGKSLVGVEIPNRVRAQVRLRNLISDPRFQEALSNLTFVLGRDVSGSPVYADLSRMPHLLVAGSTGAGKTIFLNNLILSLLYRNSPESLRFILIDPKRVEFPVYNELPHLLSPVVFDSQKAINVLKWLVSEMERRFDLLSELKARDINSYNEMTRGNEKIPIPYIILIIDELADLMAARGREIEAGIVRIAQMARAVGIHLVVATQRPSVEVITGLIKANITSRITFQVATQVDSRTVLDMAGAEKLLGRGDLLFISAETVKPKRIQGAFISEKEIKKVVDSLKIKKEIILENEIAEDLTRSLEEPEKEFEELSYQEDPLYEGAKGVVIEAKKASASLLQRRLRIGYARAARLIDILEERGVVGPGEGAKPRQVYLAIEENNEEEGWKKI